MKRTLIGLSIALGAFIALGMAPATVLAGNVTPFVGVHGNLTNSNVSCGDCGSVDVDRMAKGYGVEAGVETAIADSPVHAGLVLAYNNGERGSKMSVYDAELKKDVEIGKLESSQLALTPQVSVDLGKANLYLRAGVARDWSRVGGPDFSDNGTDRLAFTGGGGVKVSVTDHVGLYAQLMHTSANPAFDDGNITKRSNRASFGLRYTF